MSLTIRSTMNNQAGVQDLKNADKKADNILAAFLSSLLNKN